MNYIFFDGICKHMKFKGLNKIKRRNKTSKRVLFRYVYHDVHKGISLGLAKVFMPHEIHPGS